MFIRDLFQGLSVNLWDVKFSFNTSENFQTRPTIKQYVFLPTDCVLLDYELCTFYNKHIPVVKWNAPDP